ncbi:MAG: 3-oxoacyl-[acyl-carrier-protein] synthase 3 protein 2 [Phycisphaerae bacterium]|nr:3-oxoacyl-[acyl-carrier-protein] synthase 3 protein 2 [Phycisphaerae bacterium]
MKTAVGVSLEALAYQLPEEIMTSAELEEQLSPLYNRFQLRVGRLELMTGIRERRIWPVGTLPSTAATLAARRALDQAELTARDIDYLIFTSVSRDFLEPATASVVHHQLQLPDHAGYHDISNACLGFLNGLWAVANLIRLGQIRRGLVVAGENSRPLVESTIAHLLADPQPTKAKLKAAFASLTIGSGAVAAVVTKQSLVDDSPKLLGGVFRAATQHNDLCRGHGDHRFDAEAEMLMATDSEALLVAGCQLAGETWPIFLEQLGWSTDQVDRCYTHQVGVAHRQRLYEVIGREEQRDFTTVEFLGNVGSVSAPLTMAMGLEKNLPIPGMRLALLGIGSGLICGMLGWQV